LAAQQRLEKRATDPDAVKRIKKKQSFWEREIAPFFKDTYYGSDDDSDEGDPHDPRREERAEKHRQEKKEFRKQKKLEKAEIEAKAAVHVDKILKGQGASW
jgi:hypothetical protein